MVTGTAAIDKMKKLRHCQSMYISISLCMAKFNYDVRLVIVAYTLLT